VKIVRVAPGWISGRTIYQIHALGATAGRGLASLSAWVDHVAGLGCGAVLLTPIHRSATHGYDTIDPFALDPRLGTDADLERFVAACRERDLRVIFDGVFNHVGRGFARPDWLSGTVWEGHDELPTLDHSNPEVLDWATSVALHWLDRGGDGWRFDVAYSIPRPFLAELTKRIKAARPDAFLVGEMVHGDYEAMVRDTALDSVTQYELYKAIWSSLNDGNMWELAWALDRHASFATTFPPTNFLGNHDVTRIASSLLDPRHLELALAVLFTVPGIPCIYYGDELGMRGEKTTGPGGDDLIRPPLPSSIEDSPTTGQYRRWVHFRRARPGLTDAPLHVVDKTNATITYRVGSVTVRLDTVACTADIDES
jgi:cyclomaltodextrinase